MEIGSIELKNATILAPLAGITNLPFRLLAKELECGLVYSEMISANGLVRHSERTLQMLDSVPDEKPLSIQLYGQDPDIMAEAAVIAESHGADIIDLNCGCPVKKVLKTGSGAALMKDPDKVGRILTRIKKSISIPLTMKIRSGWDQTGNQAMALARIAETCGVSAIAVHPRTVSQGFGGNADWSLISAVKNMIAIPVIGNGDIREPEDALRMQQMTGCDGVMVGRAAMGNPWIFSQILSLAHGNTPERVTPEKRFEAMKRYLDSSVQYLGEQRACKMMRSRLGWLSRGLPFASKFRESIKYISTQNEAIDLINAYRESIETLAEADGFESHAV